MGILKTTLLLTAGRLLGAAFGFLVPVYVSRHLDVASFGTYKLAILCYVSALMLAHVGMDHGLFYFVKKFFSKRALFSINTILFKVATMTVVCAVALFFREESGDLLNNPQFPPVVAPLCVLSFLGVISSHMDHYFIVMNRVRFVTLLYISEAIVNAGLVIGGFYYFDSLPSVLLLMSIIPMAKTVYLLMFNLVEFKSISLSLDRWVRILRRQVSYSLPLGITNLLTFVMQFDRFVISALYNPMRFAIYAVGCLELPVLPGMINTMHDLMSIEMVEAHRHGDKEKIRQLWVATIKQIMFFLTPVVIFMIGCSDLVIVTIFSSKYSDSAEYFQAFMMVLFFFSIDPELLFRVFARTRTLLKIQIVTAILTVASFVLVAYYIGPLEALIVRAVAEALNSGVKLLYVKGMIDIRWQDLLPLKYLTHQLVIGVICVLVIKWALPHLSPTSGAILLPGSIVFYAVLFLGLGALTGLVTKEEIQGVRAVFKPKSI